MSWTTLLAEIRAEIEEGTASVWTDSMLLAWYNEGGRDFAIRSKCLQDEQYRLTVAGQRSYAWPDYTFEIDEVRYSDDTLSLSSYGDFVTLTASGTPTDFAIFDDAVYLYPTPDAAATLTLLRHYTPTPLNATATTTHFSGSHDQALKSYVKAKAFQQVGDWEQARLHRDEYELFLGEITFQGISNQAYTPATVW